MHSKLLNSPLMTDYNREINYGDWETPVHLISPPQRVLLGGDQQQPANVQSDAPSTTQFRSERLFANDTDEAEK